MLEEGGGRDVLVSEDGDSTREKEKEKRKKERGQVAHQHPIHSHPENMYEASE